MRYFIQTERSTSGQQVGGRGGVGEKALWCTIDLHPTKGAFHHGREQHRGGKMKRSEANDRLLRSSNRRNRTAPVSPP